MIYAKIDIQGKVIEYPILENTVRSRHLETSLPFGIDEKTLPFCYIIVKTSDNFDIDESFKDDIEDFTPKEQTPFKIYTIDITKAELEGIEEGEPEDLVLNSEKKKRLTLLSSSVDTLVSELTKSYKVPEVELKSWEQQLKEAQAWEQNLNTKTPLLSAIAKQRGVDETVLRLKVLKKAEFYKKLTGYLIGKKQYLEDQIESASSLSVLESIPKTLSIEEVKIYLEHI